MPEREQIKRIDIGELTENVTIAIQRALDARKADAMDPLRNSRIIIGLIFDPQIRGIGGPQQ